MAFIPLNAPSARLVYDLMNLTNSSNLDASQVTLSNYRTIDGPLNTVVEVHGNAGTTLDGQMVELTYFRLDLGVLTESNAEPILIAGDFYNLETALPLFNAKFNTGLIPAEMLGTDLDSNNNVVVTVNESQVYMPGVSVTFKHWFFDTVDRLHTLTSETLPDATAGILV